MQTSKTFRCLNGNLQLIGPVLIDDCLTKFFFGDIAVTTCFSEIMDIPVSN